MKEKYFTVAAYCPPQPKMHGRKTQITDEQYRRMSELGVDVIYGHNETVGGEREEEVFEALRLAEKYGMRYYVRDEIYHRFTDLVGTSFKPFNELTGAEKEALGEEYRKSLSRYKDYPAFGGVSFIDEPGTDMFDGIAFAKEIFERECPNKIFYVNLLPYWCEKKQYQISTQKVSPESIDEHLLAEPKACRYAYYIRSFLNTVSPKVLSFDAYPFITLGSEKTMIHAGMYEQLEINSTLAREKGVPLWSFIQGGGLWEGNMSVRVPNASEVSLHINVTAAYGAKGIEIFPYAYPRDWDEDSVAVAGLIGRDGEITPIYGYFSSAFSFLRKAEKYLAGSKFKCVSAVGEFKGGLSPFTERLEIADNDCIFDGKLRYEDVPCVDYIKASSQLLIGVFEKKNETILYVVNNSTVASVNAKIHLSGKYDCSVLQKATAQYKSVDTIGINDLPAGNAAVISIIKNN